MNLASHNHDSFISAIAIVNRNTLPLTGIPVPKTEIDIQKYLRSQFQERISKIMTTSEIRSQMIHSIDHVKFTNIRIISIKTRLYIVNDDDNNIGDKNDNTNKTLF
jgi:hypothetical protein